MHQWHSNAEQPGHEVDARWTSVLLRPCRADVMGRNMFGPIRGLWSSYDGDWRGWWGQEPPYHAPVSEAGEGDVDVSGGASTIRQALRSGELNELTIDIAPVLLGSGERIFDGDLEVSFEACRRRTFAVGHARARRDPPLRRTEGTPQAT